MFAGNPDTVARQIKEFRRRVGGVGHIIMMTRQGLVTHAEAKKSFTLAAREVLPQLQDLAADRRGRDRLAGAPGCGIGRRMSGGTARHPGLPALETERLTLRQIEAADARSTAWNMGGQLRNWHDGIIFSRNRRF